MSFNTDFTLCITHNNELIDEAPVAYDGETFILCDACYTYSYMVGGSNHGDAMRVIMAGINDGVRNGAIDHITWELISA